MIQSAYRKYFTVGFYFSVVISLLACAASQPNNEKTLSEQKADLISQIIALASDVSCSADSDCEARYYGIEPSCGPGPHQVVYSVKSMDKNQLIKLITAVGTVEEELLPEPISCPAIGYRLDAFCQDSKCTSSPGGLAPSVFN